LPFFPERLLKHGQKSAALFLDAEEWLQIKRRINRMSFLKFLFLTALGGILYFVGPFILIIMVCELFKIIGIWSLLFGFVVFCWVIWAFVNKLLF
jgi:hypothetical protein